MYGKTTGNDLRIQLWGYAYARSENRKCYCTIDRVILAKQDDFNTLAELAGITDISSESDILDEADVLLNNITAISFMLRRCTGSFMLQAVSNSNFLRALDVSPYKEMIYANEVWSDFLTMLA